MKRVTFVLTGIIIITATVLLSQKYIDKSSPNYVKIDAHILNPLEKPTKHR